MIIKSIFIKNFKAFQKETIPIYENSLILGENDSGKSTVLEALDIFFNQEKIEKVFVRDQNQSVEIGILVSDSGALKFIKKTYPSKTFKSPIVEGDINALSQVKYVFLPSEMVDVKKLISDLAVSKTINSLSGSTLNDLQTKMEQGVSEVLDSIDGDLLVIDRHATSFVSESALKLDAAFKYAISSNGVPLEGRGSGYKKTVTYSLLTKSEYDNVIIGIDEIENSLSINNACDLMKVVKDKFMQSLITTHSTAIVSCSSSDSLVPIVSSSGKTLTDLIEKLGNVDNQTFVLVEGKYDVSWINKTISLLGLSNQFVVIPCGGHGNIDNVFNELTAKGRSCKSIKDGDSGDLSCSLSKECIELFVPLVTYNSLFGINVASVPSDKASFFDTAINGIQDRSEDWVKNVIADNVNDFLDISNPIVVEIKTLLGI